jgi:hypothetical protein
MASEAYYLVKDLGFPIAMCLLLWWQGNSTIKSNTQVISDLRDYLILGKKPTKIK